MERNLLKKRINILAENSDGEMYMIEVDDYNDIVNDFRGERSFVPSNDAKIYFASLDGKPINPYAYKDFLTLVQHIREEWAFRDDYNKAGVKSQVEQAEDKTKTSVTNEKVVPPSLDELVREYEHFIEVTKDIRTVKQAKEFQEKYHIPVEINGVSINEYVNGCGHLNERRTYENIEWIRYEFFGHLWYLYDRFDGEPQFDIYYGEYGDKILAEDIYIDDLKESYFDWLLVEIDTLAKDELNKNGSIGYTMPDGLHHIYIYADFLDNEKVFVVEPNRVVDGAHEPFVGDTYVGSWEDAKEFRKGLEWCFEQFENDKEISLEDKLADATSKSQESDMCKTSEFDIEKE